MLLGTADHDFSRLRTDPRTPEQLGAALTFLFTWGTVPSLYYGDEIGMRYLPGLPDVEGSVCNPGYNRSGCRTPMQWDDSPNAGFSTAAAADLYLPIDPSDGPTDRRARRSRTPARRSTWCAGSSRCAARPRPSAAGPPTTVLHEGYPFTWRRGDSHVVVVNPRREPADVDVDGLEGARLLLGAGRRGARERASASTASATGSSSSPEDAARAAGLAPRPADRGPRAPHVRGSAADQNPIDGSGARASAWRAPARRTHPAGAR